MKPSRNSRIRCGLLAASLGVCVATALLFRTLPTPVQAQSAAPEAAKTNPPQATAISPASAAVTVAAPEISTPTVVVAAESGDPTAPPLGARGAARGTRGGIGPRGGGLDQPAGNTNEIQLSFQGANIDMIVQWLAQNTGKSVSKLSSAQGQITIMSSKPIPKRQAIDLVYRVMEAEGLSVLENNNSIFISQQAREPRLNPVLVPPTATDIPEGRQRLMKIFPLQHIAAAELANKIRGVLSDRAEIQADDRAKQLVVTDYNENLRLLGDLIKELDVVTESDTTIEILPVKHADADELNNLMTLILNSQPPSPTLSAPSASSGPSGTIMTTGPRGRGAVSISMPSGMPGGDASPSPAPPGGGGSVQTSALPIRIWTDKTSNRLIVSTPKSRLPEIQKLLDILDAEKPQDVTPRVIGLKNMTAVDLVKVVAPLFQKMGGRAPKDMIEVAADDRSNSLIVLSSEANFKSIGKLIASLDTDDAQEKVMKTFALKNADAEDVAKQLTDLNAEPDSSRSRYVYYYNDPAPAKGGKKMTVVADRRRNSVIVQAAPTAMEGVAGLIAMLDEPVTDDALAPLIYHLKYSSAADIADVLNELFLKKPQQRSVYDYIYGYGDSSSSSSSSSGEAGRLYGKVRISSEPFSNTIIISANSKENLDAVMAVLKELDESPQDGDTTVRVPLSNAKAATLANNLNILFAKGGAPPLRAANQPGQPNTPANNGGNNNNNNNQAVSSTPGFDLLQETKEDSYFPWLGGQADSARGVNGQSTTLPVSDFVGRVRIVGDERINSLLVSANPHLLSQVLKLVNEMDIPTASVVIEARIVEVSTDYLDQIGVRWSPDGSTFTANDKDNSLIASGGGGYNKGFGGNTTISPNSSAGAIATTIASLRSGFVDSTISMDFLVQFLHENTHATVLAAPLISVQDNEMGKLFVGKQVPVQTASQNSGSIGLSTSFALKPVGVILEVTPHINRSGDVALKIHAESSSIEPGVQVLGSDVFDTRAFKTDMTAKSGQTLVLAGIIQKQISDTMRKTPVLGSIPGLGWAFKKRDKTTTEVELMVFLRPRVVRSEQEAQAVLDDMDKKAPLVKEWKDGAPPPKKGTLGTKDPFEH